MATFACRLRALRRLTVAERIKLVADLWDSIAEEDPNTAFPVTPELAVELDRRMTAYERDPAAAEDWRPVRRRIAKRLRAQRIAVSSPSVSRRKK